jgi:hypothetical protein
MVAFSNIAGLPVRTGTDAPDLAASTSEQSVKLDPRVVPEFTTTTTRDAAYAAAIAGTSPYTTPLRGMRCYVQSGPGGYGDWCGWNGTEWIFDNPVPVTYNSGSIAGTSINYTTLSGHNPSLYSFTPSRSGYAEVRLGVSAQSFTPGYGTGYLRPRFSSGTLLPSGQTFTVLDDHPTGGRQDTNFFLYPVKIYLTKNVATSLAFDLASFSTTGTWLLNSAQWLVTQQ